MTLTRSLVLALTVAAGLTVTASTASAQFKKGSYGGNNAHYPKYYSLFGSHNNNLPVFQAAPWYLYWPYDAHFMTPAPVTGAFYGPPTAGNFPVNPYFPGAGAGGGYGYGQMPGGPIPRP